MPSVLKDKAMCNDTRIAELEAKVEELSSMLKLSLMAIEKLEEKAATTVVKESKGTDTTGYGDIYEATNVFTRYFDDIKEVREILKDVTLLDNMDTKVRIGKEKTSINISEGHVIFNLKSVKEFALKLIDSANIVNNKVRLQSDVKFYSEVSGSAFSLKLDDVPTNLFNEETQRAFKINTYL